MELEKFDIFFFTGFCKILITISKSARAIVKRENIRTGTFRIIRKHKTRIGYIPNMAFEKIDKKFLCLPLIGIF
ncbi:MAG: hypothetical protein FWH35_03725 [Treponema sp.]|nr:hypothetical protein [Treponema sp.]